MFSVHVLTQLADGQNSDLFSFGAFAPGLFGYIITVIALWPVFLKADVSGWAALVPIVNLYILVKIAGYHGALVLLYLIPVVGLVVGILVALKVGRAFGRSGAFSFFLLWLLSPIGYFIIGYGRSTFIGVGGQPGVQLS
jgi:hypothetical protein